MSGLLHLPKQEELFAGFRRNCRSQWGNEDVEQNATNNVAHRKGQMFAAGKYGLEGPFAELHCNLRRLHFSAHPTFRALAATTRALR
ncbi:MAG: hypothetical protein DME99_09675 [Verrucomicrobia bacterium]|nr:MAG: hypothetical protein DME99_09675 [Verrucomicrobiota bacterium]